MSPTELRVAGFPIEFRYSAIALFRKLDPVPNIRFSTFDFESTAGQLSRSIRDIRLHASNTPRNGNLSELDAMNFESLHTRQYPTYNASDEAKNVLCVYFTGIDHIIIQNWGYFMCGLEVEIMWTGRVQRLKEQCRLKCFSISTHNHKKSKHSTLHNQITKNNQIIKIR